MNDPKKPDGFSMDAELTVGFLSFTESYVSKVTCSPYDSVKVSFGVLGTSHLHKINTIRSCKAVASSSAPLFKTLETSWRFEPVPNASGGKESSLFKYDIAFVFANPLHAAISAKFFGQVSGLMMRAFEDRCEEVYGRRVAHDDVHR